MSSAPRQRCGDCVASLHCRAQLRLRRIGNALHFMLARINFESGASRDSIEE